jgi:transmembrane sensor
MSPAVLIALVAVSFATFSAMIFFLVAAYRVIRALRALTVNIERVRKSIERIIEVLLSSLRIRAVPPPAYGAVSGARVAAAVVKAAASILLPLALGVGGKAVDQAFTPHHIAVAAAAERQEIQLPDGSVLTLSAGTAFVAHLELRFRRVILDSGEVRFKVAKDPNRPFYVETPHATVKVLGTEFTVNSGTPGTHVLVHEGRVEVMHKGVVRLVRPGNSSQQSITPTAGSSILLMGADEFVHADGMIHDGTVVNAGEKRRQVSTIEFKGELLRNVIAEINRHQEQPFVIVDPEIGEEPIDGVLDNPSDRQSVMAALGVFNVRFEVDAQGRTLLYAKEKLRDESGPLP